MEQNSLAKLRKEKEMTQKELAELSGVSIRIIQKYEQGERDIRNASGTVLNKLSIALGCEMEHFFK